MVRLPTKPILVCFWLGAALHEQEMAQTSNLLFPGKKQNGLDFQFAFSRAGKKQNGQDFQPSHFHFGVFLVGRNPP